MDENITLSKTSLIALLDGLYHDPYEPIDEDNPIGPIISWALRNWSWVMLNPQPLPPVAGPVPDPWRLAGPGPQPWRTALLARVAIDRLVAEGQLAEVTAGTHVGDDAMRKRIAWFVEDICGNEPPRWPRPWPWPPKLQLRPVELLVLGAQFQKAADSMIENPLQMAFSDAADRLIGTGLERLQRAPMSVRG